MNRFSRKQTVSKFTTAVRETVDFLTAFAKASAIMTAAVLLIGANSEAQTAASKGDLQIALEQRNAACGKPQSDAANKAACEEAKRLVEAKGGIDTSSRCEQQKDEIDKLISSIAKSCSAAKGGRDIDTCYKKLNDCKTKETDLDDIDPEDEDSDEAYCSRITATECPGIARFNEDVDYIQDRKDAETDRKEAKKELDALMDDERDIKKDLAKQQREIQEEQQTAAYEARQQEREISNSLKDALKGISENQKKAFENVQKAYTEMDAQYIKMRREVRLTGDAVAQAEDDLEESCRGVAEKKYNEAEKIRLAAQKQGRSNVGAAVSGSTKRKRAIKAKARLIDYTAFFNECKNGTSAEGASARNKIKTALRAKATNDALLLEQAALIEAERERMLKQIQTMESDATNQQSEVVEAISEQLTAMNEKRTLVAQQNQSRIAEFQQNQNASLQSTQQKIAAANQEHMKTQKESSIASKRFECAGPNARRSSAAREKIADGFQNGIVDIQRLDDRCKKLMSCPAESGPASKDATTANIAGCIKAAAALKASAPGTGATGSKSGRTNR